LTCFSVLVSKLDLQSIVEKFQLPALQLENQLQFLKCEISFKAVAATGEDYIESLNVVYKISYYADSNFGLGQFPANTKLCVMS
jgi:hypothetical protein